MSASRVLSEKFRRLWSSKTVAGPFEAEHVARVKEFAATFGTFSDRDLREHTEKLRQVVADGTDVLDRRVLLPGLAMTVAAIHRVTGLRIYDVQLMAGLRLAQGAVVEMKTGEGKTLAAALPAFVHALSGQSVHVLTVNSYLAHRDWELMVPIFRPLGMSVGLLTAHAPRQRKVWTYASDVIYGPGYEFGFDYLRDQVAMLRQASQPLGRKHRDALRGTLTQPVEPVQHTRAFAVIDEIDSVLIDEATTPLVLSETPAHHNTEAEPYRRACQLAEQLVPTQDYVVDELRGRVKLTKDGMNSAVSTLKVAPGGQLRRPWHLYVENAITAKLLLRRDVHYVVDEDGHVKLVDEPTGRVFDDRAWRDGLHQAVEAFNGLPVTSEQRPMARICRQKFTRLYDGFCGMTGTAKGAEREFWNVYRKRVFEIPTRKPVCRREWPLRVFRDAGSKWKAIVQEIEQVRGTGRPVLCGTRTIEQSEELAARLDALKIPYRLLNGKQDAAEAEIIAQAGQRSAVTIATNMAGRGTDIKLQQGVDAIGGLHVIGAELHESERVDRQLAGRAARQGDPGSVRFYASAEDRLVRVYAPWLGRRLRRLADANAEVNVDVSQEFLQVQRRAERLNRLRRQQLLAHDDWLDDVLGKLSGRT